MANLSTVSTQPPHTEVRVNRRAIMKSSRSVNEGRGGACFHLDSDVVHRLRAGRGSADVYGTTVHPIQWHITVYLFFFNVGKAAGKGMMVYTRVLCIPFFSFLL